MIIRNPNESVIGFEDMVRDALLAERVNSSAEERLLSILNPDKEVKKPVKEATQGWTCDDCTHENELEDEVCQGDGCEEEKPEYWTCPNCDENVYDMDADCDDCGYPHGEEDDDGRIMGDGIAQAYILENGMIVLCESEDAWRERDLLIMGEDKRQIDDVLREMIRDRHARLSRFLEGGSR